MCNLHAKHGIVHAIQGKLHAIQANLHAIQKSELIIRFLEYKETAQIRHNTIVLDIHRIGAGYRGKTFILG